MVNTMYTNPALSIFSLTREGIASGHMVGGGLHEKFPPIPIRISTVLHTATALIAM